RWARWNLAPDDESGLGGALLGELHRPQIATAGDPSAPTQDAWYGMGWFIDSFGGQRRISHGGYWNDVNSEIALLPEAGIGVVAYANFVPPRFARFLTDRALEILLGLPAAESIEDRLAAYEAKVAALAGDAAGPEAEPDGGDP